MCGARSVNNSLSTVASDEAWFRSLMEISLYSPTANSSTTTTTSGTQTAVATALPPELQTLRDANLAAYNEFTCSRNLPSCQQSCPGCGADVANPAR